MKCKKIFAQLILFLTLFMISTPVFAQNIFYWENTKSLIPKEANFPVTINQGENSYIFWQDVNTSKKQIYLSCRHYTSLDDYKDNLKFAGPFNYSGDIPSIYSASISDEGELILAVASDLGKVTIFKSNDEGKSFERFDIKHDTPVLDPRIFYSSFGYYVLFGSTTENNSYHIYISESWDGEEWDSFAEFTPSRNLSNAFVPYLVQTDDGDTVVFQARHSSRDGKKTSYQLFGTSTEDGENWSNAVMLTNDVSLSSNDTRNFIDYSNQRPNLYYHDNRIFMIWERSFSGDTSLWVEEIDKKGVIPRSAKQISKGGTASRGILFEFDGSLYAEWISKEGTNTEKIAYTSYSLWDWGTETKISIPSADRNIFSAPIVTVDEYDNPRMFFVWQQTKKESNSISALLPDRTVAMPKLSAVSFTSGKRSTKKDVEIKITYPDDSSGIRGYNYTWGKNNETIPDKVLNYQVSKKASSNSASLKLSAPEDGVYYLYVRVQDKAGNWSEAEKIRYHRDITPPAAPVIKTPDQDAYGMLSSNSYVVYWNPPADNDVNGYNYTIEYMGKISDSLVVNATHSIKMNKTSTIAEVNRLKSKYQKDVNSSAKLKNTVITTKTRTGMNENQNVRNGIYMITVCAIDGVGNVSKPARRLLVLNKYAPATVINSVEKLTDDVGRDKFNIYGDSFLYEGTIDHVYIDMDGQEPYDFIATRERGDFKVVSDSKIEGITIGTYLDKGLYRIGLDHSDRGVTFSPAILQFEQTGTIKIQPEYVYRPKYTKLEIYTRYIISIYAVILVLLILLVIGIPQMLLVTISQHLRDKKLTRKEIKAMITGDNMPLLTKSSKNRKSRKSLRTRVVAFTVALVILVVGLLTYRNGMNMIEIQQNTLVSALEERINVLMVSLNSGIKNNLPNENIEEIGLLPSQTEGMAEVQYVTILGRRRGAQPEDEDYGDLNYVWASNDPNISDKILTTMNTDQISTDLISGRSKIIDDEIMENLNKIYPVQTEAEERIHSMLQEININSQEIRKMYKDGDEEMGDKLSERNTDIRKNITKELSDFATEMGYTTPELTANVFNTTDREFIFYRPVLYNIGSSDQYLNGVIILQVSVQNLIDQINAEVQSIIYQGIILGVVAIIIGWLGAGFVASFIVKPIRKLERHIQVVGDLLTKSPRERMRLQKMEINIRSKDEIGRLGDVVNKMALTVGNAAEDDYLNKDGKKVQNCFIPLNEGTGGKKLPFAKYQEDELDLFAFYKGDSDVSGDYFDYKKLDETWYVFIKCDVSGHGVPAALIVSVVATKFKEYYYFNNWNARKNGINLTSFVSAVNDFIFELGARGKFSTINISLYNKHTGELYICNAGDNKIHILDNKTKRLKEITLANLPTAGGVSNDMIEMKGGFQVEKLQLNHGDVLYLYTDGIDEAERLVRNKNYEVRTTVITEEKFNRQTRKMEKEEKKNDVKEQFGQERITQVIEAVQKKGVYVLEKEDNPTNEVLQFDFSSCEGTIEESIIALAAIERVFRMVKMPDVRESDEIEMEKRIDEFLKEHFSLYSKYCMPVKNQEENDDPDVTRYSYIVEDSQADDITLIAIRRP